MLLRFPGKISAHTLLRHEVEGGLVPQVRIFRMHIDDVLQQAFSIVSSDVAAYTVKAGVNVMIFDDKIGENFDSKYTNK
jgi:hypothetical protein